MKDIKGWEGIYAITKNGKVWAHSRVIKKKSPWSNNMCSYFWPGHWMAINSTKQGDWYYSIALGSKGPKRKGYKIHRLVAQAYIPNPLNLPEINHKNGNKGDNRVENLEWCTRKENLEHGYKITPMAKRTNAKKLIAQDIINIRKEYAEKKPRYKDLGKKYSVCGATVGEIIRREIWKHI